MINLMTGIAFNHGLNEVDKIHFVTRITTYPLYLARRHINTRDQCLSPMALIFEFSRLRFARPHGQIRCDPLQGLDARHLIDTEDDFLLYLRCLLIERTDIRYALLFALVSFGI